jgi:hypothetical protein
MSTIARPPLTLVVHSVFFFGSCLASFFRNPQIYADFFRFRGTHVGTKLFQGKINLFRNPTEPRIRPESGGKDP